MKPISHYIDYVRNKREPIDIGMSSAYEIVMGVNNTMAPDAKRNGHLWCYSNDSIKEVENWQEVLCGHRISIVYFDPLGIKSLDKQYAARAV